MTGTQSALVSATYGRRFDLGLPDGRTVPARVKGRRLRPVCGDRVQAEPIANEPDWLIVSIDARDNELTRPNQRGKTEVLAANLDFLGIVCAVTPAADWYVVDRYLCAAELMGCGAAVIYNKVDDGEPSDGDARELQNYGRIGYETLVCSAKSGRHVDRLGALLDGHTAIIVGQSGVGKSSLINALTESDQRTAEISTSRGEGRHTTVNSVMLPLPGGGKVVDSPGVRDYAPAIELPADVEAGFREIHEHGRNCRFSNCRHRREPGCAVKDAVPAGNVHERRYDSYRRMLNLTEQRDRSRY